MKATKRKGGRIYIAETRRGEVSFHEGYVTAKEGHRVEHGGETDAPKPARPELSGPLTTYVDLHRHAAVRTALNFQPHLALRAMVADAIAGSGYWSVRPEPQTARNDATAESVENSGAEFAFDERRRALLDLFGADPDTPHVINGVGSGKAASILLRLIDLPDAAVLDVVAIDVGASRMTALDRSLLRDADTERVVFAAAPDPHAAALRAGRLRTLQSFGLARDVGRNRWQLADDLEATLRAMGERGDIIRTLRCELTARRLDRQATDRQSSASKATARPSSGALSRAASPTSTGIVTIFSSMRSMGKRIMSTSAAAKCSNPSPRVRSCASRRDPRQFAMPTGRSLRWLRPTTVAIPPAGIFVTIRRRRRPLRIRTCRFFCVKFASNDLMTSGSFRPVLSRD